jgi:hypothetical protein
MVTSHGIPRQMPRTIIDRDENELAKVARAARAVAAQAEALSSLEKALPSYIDGKSTLAIIAADTVVFENYNNPEPALAWLNQALRAWLRTNAQLNAFAEGSIFYRYLVFPYPFVLENWAARADLIRTILLNVHLQLWHGIVCGVIFADPRRHDLSELIRVASFAAMPAHNLIFDLPGFYQSKSIRNQLLEGPAAHLRFEEIRKYFQERRMEPIWLFYDDQNFNGPRLTGWRWEANRRFFNNLCQPGAQCLGCGVVLEKFALDHIAPVSKGYFQTILNFQLLCGPCNSKKGTLGGPDPYVVPMLLPNAQRSRELDEIFYQRPPWLGSLIRPGSKRELFARNLGLD